MSAHTIIIAIITICSFVSGYVINGLIAQYKVKSKIPKIKNILKQRIIDVNNPELNQQEKNDIIFDICSEQNMRCEFAYGIKFIVDHKNNELNKIF